MWRELTHRKAQGMGLRGKKDYLEESRLQRLGFKKSK